MFVVKFIIVCDEIYLMIYIVEGMMYNFIEGGVVGASKKFDASLRVIVKIFVLCNGV